jgi:8-oxo-dGTP pyrophosphatase MutT (NUDIX family)
MQPIIRPAARVILIDASQQILLMQHRGEDVPFVWATPGGGIEPGETPEQAALRELGEEVGLRDAVLGPCVWLRKHLFPWQGAVYDVRERFFVCRIDAYEVGSHVNEDEVEREWDLGNRWWSLDEIAASEEVFVPRALANLLPALLRGEYPYEPFEVGI